MSRVFDIFSYFAKRHKYFLPLAIFCCIMFCAGAALAANASGDPCEGKDGHDLYKVFF